jgi:hypothetical protein
MHSVTVVVYMTLCIQASAVYSFAKSRYRCNDVHGVRWIVDKDLIISDTKTQDVVLGLEDPCLSAGFILHGRLQDRNNRRN